jgi:hypothetical protein
MTIKEEYVDCSINHPATGKTINLKWLDPNEYDYIYANGYQHLFNEDGIIMSSFSAETNIESAIAIEENKEVDNDISE